MLLSLPQNNGAELRLDQNVRLQLAFDPDDYSQEWSFRVLDSEERVSFLMSCCTIRWFANGILTTVNF